MKQFFLKHWVRWILVLPAALGAYLACNAIVAICIGISDFFWETGSKNWRDLITSLACPACFTWYGAKTAPHNRFIVGVCLTVIQTIAITVVITAIAVKSGNVPEFSLHLAWLAILIIGGVVTPIMACYALHKEEMDLSGIHSGSQNIDDVDVPKN